jgi:phage-related minor tail protein
MLAPPIQQMLQQKQQGTNIPPQVQAELAQSQQQIEQLQAELQKAQKPTAVEEIRQQGENQRTMLELRADSETNRANNETKLAVAELGAKVDRLTLFLEERARLGVQDHEVGMTAMAQAHAADQAAAGRSADTEAAEAARAHEAEMAERAAAMQPQGEA